MPPVPPLPLNPARDVAYLKAVQGNILKGHGRQHLRLVFFRFRQTTAANQALLRQTVAPTASGVPDPNFGVTSAYQQWTDARGASRNEVLRSLALTREGLVAAGLAPQPDQALQMPAAGSAAPAFNLGFRRSRLTTFVPDPGDKARWLQAYRDEAAHGVWLVACEDPGILDGTAVPNLMTFWGNAAQVEWLTEVERGTVWKAAGQAREPFGFADGLSVPAFFDSDRLPVPPARSIDIPLAHVVIDPSADQKLAGSSFLVLQKLEQDVGAFYGTEALIAAQLTAKLGVSPAEAGRLAGALLIGRDREGRPLVDQLKTLPPDQFNQFDFNTGTPGPDDSRCPFHAHIRKANPRYRPPPTDRNSLPEKSQVDAQFVRRSMIYDPAGQLPTGARPAAGQADSVGLLFMAYMANIADQFEKLQGDWMPRASFPAPGSRADSMLFGNDLPWKYGPLSLDKLPQFVHSLGGEYFLVPSIEWLARGGV